MIKNIILQSKVRRGVSFRPEIFFFFVSWPNYLLFKLPRTIELLKIKLIIYEFLRNNTPDSHTHT